MSLFCIFLIIFSCKIPELSMFYKIIYLHAIMENAKFSCKFSSGYDYFDKNCAFRVLTKWSVKITRSNWKNFGLICGKLRPFFCIYCKKMCQLNNYIDSKLNVDFAPGLFLRKNVNISIKYLRQRCPEIFR